MRDEELSQFYQYEAVYFSNWVDRNLEQVLNDMVQPGDNTFAWNSRRGRYVLTKKQMEDFMAIRKSPLYEALK